MNGFFLVVLVLLAFAGFAMAQLTQPTTDVLGAHLNYGRGCTACHSPHSGTAGNGQRSSAVRATRCCGAKMSARSTAKPLLPDGGKYVEVLPTSMSADTPDVSGMLTCLGCHDGNYGSSSHDEEQGV